MHKLGIHWFVLETAVAKELNLIRFKKTLPSTVQAATAGLTCSISYGPGVTLYLLYEDTDHPLAAQSKVGYRKRFAQV